MSVDLDDWLNVSIEPEICDACCAEQGWAKRIEAVLEQEFPGIEPSRGVPANHPYMARHRELWAAHKQPVMHIHYDDGRWGFCRRHLLAIAQLFMEGR